MQMEIKIPLKESGVQDNIDGNNNVASGFKALEQNQEGDNNA